MGFIGLTKYDLEIWLHLSVTVHPVYVSEKCRVQYKYVQMVFKLIHLLLRNISFLLDVLFSWK